MPLHCTSPYVKDKRSSKRCLLKILALSEDHMKVLIMFAVLRRQNVILQVSSLHRLNRAHPGTDWSLGHSYSF